MASKSVLRVSKRARPRPCVSTARPWKKSASGSRPDPHRRSVRPTGRFAPSPSGPLHAGSLLAALASYVDARQRGGRWLLRIDDLDPDRSSPTATRDILDCLAAHGLHHDGPVRYASSAADRHHRALDALWQAGLVYACRCRRAVLRAHAADVGHPRYSGACRALDLPRAGHAARLRVGDKPALWQSAVGHSHSERVDTAVGDFALQRRDGVIAYQLAVVVDDADDRVTDVVRGADLLDNTGRQVYLHRALGLALPRYLHVPVLHGDDGRKLSKSNGAHAVDPATALPNLQSAWDRLGQMPSPTDIRSTDTFLTWATAHWRRDRASHDGDARP
ncbi:MAG: tRNA glutamyl-Q(34) synthetase GluQRS [Pseudomonadota bacterium]